MKQPCFIMPLLIPRPMSPGNGIEVYLHPLIEELNKLWSNDVNMYDSHNGTSSYMHVALLRTISDFLTYEMLSGWNIKGLMACPHRQDEVSSYQR